MNKFKVGDAVVLRNVEHRTVGVVSRRDSGDYEVEFCNQHGRRRKWFSEAELEHAPLYALHHMMAEEICGGGNG